MPSSVTKLGEANAKRFQAGVTALLKTSDNKGELALAILEGRADSSKKCLVQFEPRALDYKKVCEILKTTGDEAKALQAGKTEARAENGDNAANFPSLTGKPKHTEAQLASPRPAFPLGGYAEPEVVALFGASMPPLTSGGR